MLQVTCYHSKYCIYNSIVVPVCGIAVYDLLCRLNTSDKDEFDPLILNYTGADNVTSVIGFVPFCKHLLALHCMTPLNVVLLSTQLNVSVLTLYSTTQWRMCVLDLLLHHVLWMGMTIWLVLYAHINILLFTNCSVIVLHMLVMGKDVDQTLIMMDTLMSSLIVKTNTVWRCRTCTTYEYIHTL